MIEVDLYAWIGGVSDVVFELVNCRIEDHEFAAADHRRVVGDVVDSGEAQTELADLFG